MADCDLDVLSLTVLSKLYEDIAKAITAYEDRQKAKVRVRRAEIPSH
jgi:DNA-binding protein H-NS